MNKQNTVYITNEILFSLKREENSDTCYYMVEQSSPHPSPEHFSLPS